MLKNLWFYRYGRALGYVMLNTKIDKNRPSILLKTAPKSTLQFVSILEQTLTKFAPFWEGFGGQDGAKLAQIAPKIDPAINQQK